MRTLDLPPPTGPIPKKAPTGEEARRHPDGSLVLGPPEEDIHRAVRLPDQLVAVLRAHGVVREEERLEVSGRDDRGRFFPSGVGTPREFSIRRRLVKECRRRSGSP